MRHLFTLSALLLLSLLGASPHADAGGPLGLFDRLHGCDSVGCDTIPCGSDHDGCDVCDRLACDCDVCDRSACGCLGGGCDASGCDSGGLLGRTSGGLLNGHSLDELFRRDACSRTYVSILGGWNDADSYFGNDEEEMPPPPTPAIREGTFNDGWAIGGAIGRQVNQAVRGEFEFTFRSNTADQWAVNGVPVGEWDGDLFAYSLMTNLYHDFANLRFHGWRPYVGGGIGIAFLDGDFSTAMLDLEIDDELFAYQFMAGANKTLTSNVDLFLEYRYFATDDFDLVNRTPMPAVGFGKDDYEADSIFVGFRVYR